MRLYNAALCTPVGTPGVKNAPRSFIPAAQMQKPCSESEVEGPKYSRGACRMPYQSPRQKAQSGSCLWLPQNGTASTSSSETSGRETPRFSSDPFHFDISVVRDQSKKNNYNALLEDNFSKNTDSTLSTRVSLSDNMESQGKSRYGAFSVDRGSERDWTEYGLETSELPPPAQVHYHQISYEEQRDPFWETAKRKAEVKQRDQATLPDSNRITLFPTASSRGSKAKWGSHEPAGGNPGDHRLDESSWTAFDDKFADHWRSQDWLPRIETGTTQPETQFPLSSRSEARRKSTVEQRPQLEPSRPAAKSSTSLPIRLEHVPVRPWKVIQKRAEQASNDILRGEQRGQENAHPGRQIPQVLSTILEERFQRAQKLYIALHRGAHPVDKLDDCGLIKRPRQGMTVDELGFPWESDDDAVILMVRSREEDSFRPATSFVRSSNGQWAEIGGY